MPEERFERCAFRKSVLFEQISPSNLLGELTELVVVEVEHIATFAEKSDEATVFREREWFVTDDGSSSFLLVVVLPVVVCQIRRV